MSDLMKAAIKEAITKNLPAEIGENLQILLKEREDFKAELKKSKSTIEKLWEDNSNIKSQIANLKALELFDGDLNKRETEVILKEKIIKLRESQAHDRVNDMKELTSLVFKNPVFKTSSFTNRFHDEFNKSSSNDSTETTTQIES